MNNFWLAADILIRLCQGHGLEIPKILNILCYFLNIHTQFKGVGLHMVHRDYSQPKFGKDTIVRNNILLIWIAC